jgi:putative transcriptional regulator
MAAREIDPQPGVLLIAPPMMQEPNFRRTVVLLCEHGAEGTFGLILNRPLTLRLSEVIDSADPVDTFLSLGGPVQPDTLHMLHRCGQHVPEAVTVLDGVCWGGDFEVIKSLVETGRAGAQELRFFLGYAGWSEGQLASEIAADGWIVSRADEALIFREQPEALWRTALRRMGGDYAMLANFPEDPRLN